jgi:hypothetical protein
MSLQPIVEYLTFLLSLLFSTPFLLLFFSTILLPPTAFICAHSFTLPFPLLFVVVFQLHSLHSYYCEFQTLNMCTTSNNKHKLLSTVTLFFLLLEHLIRHIHFFIYPLFFN